MAVDVGSAVGYLDLDISGFLANLKTAQSEANSAGKSIASKIESSFTSAGKTITAAGTTLTKTVTLPIVGIGTAAVKATSDFDSAMSKVSAISGATGDDFDSLRSKAVEMGAKTKFSATESAEAFTYMAMAGWKTEDMLEGIDGIMALSAADGLDLATTSDIVTDALTAFGLEAKDSGHFADVLAKASSSANTNVSLLGESFKYAAPVAGALGYSAEDVAVALGLMANAGIKGSQGGTALRSSLSRLIKPTDDAAAMMEKYGLSLTNADGTMKPLGSVMDMLRDKLGGLSEAEQAQVAATLFGQEAMSGMLAIINTADKDYENLTNSVYDADGAAQQMADTMLNNLSGQITLLKSALEGLAIQIGDIIMPYLIKFVKKLQDLVQKFQSLDDQTKENIVKFAAIAAAIGPVLVIIGKLVTSIGTIAGAFGKLKTLGTALSTGFKALGAAIGGISAPVIAIIAIIAVLIAAFVNLWKNNEEFRDKMTAIWDGIKEKFNSFAQGIVDRLNALGFDFENITEVLKAIWDGFCELLAPVFEAAFNIISSVLGTVLDVLTGLLDVFIGLFTGNWEQLWTGVKEIFSGIWDGIVGIFSAVWNMILGILDTVCGWFGTTWNDTWNSIKEFFVNIWNSIKDFFTNMGNSIAEGFRNFIDNVVSFFSELPYNIGVIIGEVIGTIAKFVIDMVAKARELGKNFIDNVINFFRELPGNILNFITSALTNVQVWVPNMINQARTMATNFVNNIVSLLTDLPGKIKQFLDSAINNCKIWVTQMGQKGREAIQTLISNVVSAASGIAEKVMSIGSDIVSGVWKGIQNAAGWFRDKVSSFFSGIVDGVKNALGIGSPSKVFAKEVGRWLPPGVAQGFEGALPAAIKQIQKDLNKGVDSIEADDISIGAQGTVMTATNAFKNIYDELSVWFESVETRIGNSVSRMMQSLSMLIEAGQVVVNSDGTLGYVGYGGFAKTNQNTSRSRFGSNNENNRPGEGDTFIFYSNKSIDEIEAAKQMKSTKRDMAEGF